jgi:hypothetical protein
MSNATTTDGQLQPTSVGTTNRESRAPAAAAFRSTNERAAWQRADRIFERHLPACNPAREATRAALRSLT